MTNAEKQRNYRKRLEERQKKRAIEAITLSTNLMDAYGKIQNIEYQVNLKETKEDDIEQLKIDFQKPKEENRKLKKENAELRKKYSNVYVTRLAPFSYLL
jgi:hypothetical protein